MSDDATTLDDIASLLEAVLNQQDAQQRQIGELHDALATMQIVLAIIHRATIPNDAMPSEVTSAAISARAIAAGFMAAPASKHHDAQEPEIVELGGERIDLAKLDATTRKIVEEMVANAQLREERKRERCEGLAHIQSVEVKDGDASNPARQALKISTERLRSGTADIHRMIEERTREREGPTR